jgi:hypothetical protein
MFHSSRILTHKHYFSDNLLESLYRSHQNILFKYKILLERQIKNFTENSFFQIYEKSKPIADIYFSALDDILAKKKSLSKEALVSLFIISYRLVFQINVKLHLDSIIENNWLKYFKFLPKVLQVFCDCIENGTLNSEDFHMLGDEFVTKLLSFHNEIINNISDVINVLDDLQLFFQFHPNFPFIHLSVMFLFSSLLKAHHLMNETLFSFLKFFLSVPWVVLPNHFLDYSNLISIFFSFFNSERKKYPNEESTFLLVANFFLLHLAPFVKTIDTPDFEPFFELLLEDFFPDFSLANLSNYHWSENFIFNVKKPQFTDKILFSNDAKRCYSQEIDFSKFPPKPFVVSKVFEFFNILCERNLIYVISFIFKILGKAKISPDLSSCSKVHFVCFCFLHFLSSYNVSFISFENIKLILQYIKFFDKKNVYIRHMHFCFLTFFSKIIQANPSFLKISQEQYIFGPALESIFVVLNNASKVDITFAFYLHDLDCKLKGILIQKRKFYEEVLSVRSLLLQFFLEYYQLPNSILSFSEHNGDFSDLFSIGYELHSRPVAFRIFSSFLSHEAGMPILAKHFNRHFSTDPNYLSLLQEIIIAISQISEPRRMTSSFLTSKFPSLINKIFKYSQLESLMIPILKTIVCHLQFSISFLHLLPFFFKRAFSFFSNPEVIQILVQIPFSYFDEIIRPKYIIELFERFEKSNYLYFFLGGIHQKIIVSPENSYIIFKTGLLDKIIQKMSSDYFEISAKLVFEIGKYCFGSKELLSFHEQITLIKNQKQLSFLFKCLHKIRLFSDFYRTFQINDGRNQYRTPTFSLLNDFEFEFYVNPSNKCDLITVYSCQSKITFSFENSISFFLSTPFSNVPIHSQHSSQLSKNEKILIQVTKQSLAIIIKNEMEKFDFNFVLFPDNGFIRFKCLNSESVSSTIKIRASQFQINSELSLLNGKSINLFLSPDSLIHLFPKFTDFSSFKSFFIYLSHFPLLEQSSFFHSSLSFYLKNLKSHIYSELFPEKNNDSILIQYLIQNLPVIIENQTLRESFAYSFFFDFHFLSTLSAHILRFFNSTFIKQTLLLDKSPNLDFIISFNDLVDGFIFLFEKRSDLNFTNINCSSFFALYNQDSYVVKIEFIFQRLTELKGVSFLFSLLSFFTKFSFIPFTTFFQKHHHSLSFLLSFLRPEFEKEISIILKIFSSILSSSQFSQKTMNYGLIYLSHHFTSSSPESFLKSIANMIFPLFKTSINFANVNIYVFPFFVIFFQTLFPFAKKQNGIRMLSLIMRSKNHHLALGKSLPNWEFWILALGIISSNLEYPAMIFSYLYDTAAYFRLLVFVLRFHFSGYIDADQFLSLFFKCLFDRLFEQTASSEIIQQILSLLVFTVISVQFSLLQNEIPMVAGIPSLTKLFQAFFSTLFK